MHSVHTYTNLRTYNPAQSHGFNVLTRHQELDCEGFHHSAESSARLPYSQTQSCGINPRSLPPSIPVPCNPALAPPPAPRPFPPLRPCGGGGGQCGMVGMVGMVACKMGDDNAEAGGRGAGLPAWESQALVVRRRCVQEGVRAGVGVWG